MNYRTETLLRCSRPVLEDNPLLTLFAAIEQQQREPGLRLCCVHCQTAITSANDKTEINYRHTFQLTNPDGIAFNVACFKEAWGCGLRGEVTAVHSWFAGYCWQYAYCVGCEAQLGWYYTNGFDESGSSGHFFGLIADKLLPVEDGR